MSAIVAVSQQVLLQPPDGNGTACAFQLHKSKAQQGHVHH